MDEALGKPHQDAILRTLDGLGAPRGSDKMQIFDEQSSDELEKSMSADLVIPSKYGTATENMIISSKYGASDFDRT